MLIANGVTSDRVIMWTLYVMTFYHFRHAQQPNVLRFSSLQESLGRSSDSFQHSCGFWSLPTCCPKDLLVNHGHHLQPIMVIICNFQLPWAEWLPRGPTFHPLQGMISIIPRGCNMMQLPAMPVYRSFFTLLLYSFGNTERATYGSKPFVEVGSNWALIRNSWSQPRFTVLVLGKSTIFFTIFSGWYILHWCSTESSPISVGQLINLRSMNLDRFDYSMDTKLLGV